MKTLNQFMEMRGFKDEVARVDRNAERVAARKKRQNRTDAALEKVRKAEAAARERAPERREATAQKEQARKQREARKTAATQRVADASKSATLSNVTSKGSRLGGQKQTMKSKQRIPNTIKKPSTRNTPPTKPQPEKKSNAYAAGLKSSLGGDVLSKNELERRRARRELGRKTGRAIRSAPGKVIRGVGRAAAGALKANDAASQGNFEGQESGQLSGGSRYIDRTKQS